MKIINRLRVNRMGYYLILLSITFISSNQVLSQDLSFEWAKHYGEESDNYSSDMVVAPSGNIYYAGVATEEIRQYIYFVKLTPDGEKVWVTEIESGLHNIKSPKIDLDENENIIALVNYENEFGKRPEKLVKLDSDGNILWEKPYSYNYPFSKRGIVLDKSGYIYVWGYLYERLDVDLNLSQYIINSEKNNVAFICKYDSDGNFEWAKTITNTQSVWFQDVELDDNGDICCLGGYEGTVDVDPGVGVYELSNSTFSSFLLKLTSTGEFLLATHITGSARNFTVDSDGCFILSGDFSDIYNESEKNIDKKEPKKNKAYPDYILKLDNETNCLWVKALATTFVVEIEDICSGEYGSCYLTGAFRGELVLDPGMEDGILVSEGLEDVFIVKLDNQGVYKWATSTGASGEDYGKTIYVYEESVISLGTYFNTIDLDPGPGNFNISAYDSKVDTYIQKLNHFYDRYGYIEESFCDSYLSPSGDEYWYEEGHYYDTIATPYGYDSIVSVSLIPEVNTEVIISDQSLIALESDANSYQWYLYLEDGSLELIPGEISNTIVASDKNKYIVEITKNDCVDYSSPIQLSDFVYDNEIPYSNVNVYPNPVQNHFIIDFGEGSQELSLELRDLYGRLVFFEKVENQKQTRVVLNELPGVYYLIVSGDKGSRTIKIVKQ
jgi:hypothetical protein